jgi:hypothetical protein
MSRFITCPFDSWKNDTNDQLQGGELLGVQPHRFSYRYVENGRTRRVLVAGRSHGDTIVELLTQYVDEMAILLPEAIGALGEVEAYSVYASEGRVAGALIRGHAHLNLIPRYSDEPATNMGLEGLIKEYNSTMRQLWSSGT